MAAAAARHTSLLHKAGCAFAARSPTPTPAMAGRHGQLFIKRVLPCLLLTTSLDTLNEAPDHQSFRIVFFLVRFAASLVRSQGRQLDWSVAPTGHALIVTMF